MTKKNDGWMAGKIYNVTAIRNTDQTTGSQKQAKLNRRHHRATQKWTLCFFIKNR